MRDSIELRWQKNPPGLWSGWWWRLWPQQLIGWKGIQGRIVVFLWGAQHLQQITALPQKKSKRRKHFTILFFFSHSLTRKCTQGLLLDFLWRKKKRISIFHYKKNIFSFLDFYIVFFSIFFIFFLFRVDAASSFSFSLPNCYRTPFFVVSLIFFIFFFCYNIHTHSLSEFYFGYLDFLLSSRITLKENWTFNKFRCKIILMKTILFRCFYSSVFFSLIYIFFCSALFSISSLYVHDAGLCVRALLNTRRNGKEMKIFKCSTKISTIFVSLIRFIC